MNKPQRPWLGYGLGLRPPHYEEILTADDPAVDWFEILTENYLATGGRPRDYLLRIAERYPLVMHGVSLSIGSTDPLDRGYLAQVKALADEIQPRWISDHLCWTGNAHTHLHDLLPLPYTEEAVRHVATRLREVQDYLERPVLLENVSSYVTFRESELTEWEFLSAISEEADSLILLDVNNIYVSAFNHDFDPHDYVNGIAPERVWQIHIAGHTHNGDFIVDTHDHPVGDPVWSLYDYTLRHIGAPVSTMIERDDHIPPFQALLDELETARDIGRRFEELAA
ncbi:MAG: DUF692 domain-containing protein [Gammaproteobacteria bacterium]